MQTTCSQNQTPSDSTLSEGRGCCFPFPSLPDKADKPLITRPTTEMESSASRAPTHTARTTARSQGAAHASVLPRVRNCGEKRKESQGSKRCSATGDVKQRFYAFFPPSTPRSSHCEGLGALPFINKGSHNTVEQRNPFFVAVKFLRCSEVPSALGPGGQQSGSAQGLTSELGSTQRGTAPQNQGLLLGLPPGLYQEALSLLASLLPAPPGSLPPPSALPAMPARRRPQITARDTAQTKGAAILAPGGSGVAPSRPPPAALRLRALLGAGTRMREAQEAVGSRDAGVFLPPRPGAMLAGVGMGLSVWGGQPAGSRCVLWNRGLSFVPCASVVAGVLP